jgi:hypothetical protein
VRKKKIKKVDSTIHILMPKCDGKVFFVSCPESLRELIKSKPSKAEVRFLQGG